MIRVRVVCPPDRTQEVTDTLSGHDGVTDVVRFPGAALHPAGDVIEADIAREATDGTLDDLQALDLGDGHTVSLTGLDVILGPPAKQAQASAPGSGEDAVVWDELAAVTGEGSSLSAAFLLFFVVATMIAAVGLITDSQVLIVGSMILGPDFGPLAGIAVGLVRRRWSDCWDPLRALLVGFPAGILLTAGLVAVLNASGLIDQPYLAGQRPEVSFVYQPGAFSVIVALLAGVAGTVSLTASKSATLVGVFVSVTTIPAAAEIGGGLVTGQVGRAGSALEQLAINLGCIVVAAILTLSVQRRIWRRVQKTPARRRAATWRRLRRPR